MTMFNIANQANIEAARVAFHAAFLENLGLVDEQPLEQALLEVPSTTKTEEWDWLGDMPGFEEWEGDRIIDVMKGFNLRLTNKDWSAGLALHQNNFKDDKLGLFAPQIATLAENCKAHRAEFTAQLLMNGFDGVAFPKVGNGLAYDGKFFFDTTRATGSNRSVVALDLTGAALVDAELKLGSQTSYNGRRKLRGLTGTHLVVGPKLRSVADKLMGSDYLASTAGTATESNYFKGRYKVIEEPWMAVGSAFESSWMLLCLSKAFKPCMFLNREPISTSAILGGQGTSNDSTERFKTGRLLFGAEARYTAGYLEARLAVGYKP